MLKQGGRWRRMEGGRLESRALFALGGMRNSTDLVEERWRREEGAEGVWLSWDGAANEAVTVEEPRMERKKK